MATNSLNVDRDNLTSFSGWLSKLHKTRDIPVNALYASTAVIVVLRLLNIASTAAFNAYLSLAVAALYLSYLMPMVAMVYRRILNPQTLAFGPWKLNMARHCGQHHCNCIHYIST